MIFPSNPVFKVLILDLSYYTEFFRHSPREDRHILHSTVSAEVGDKVPQVDLPFMSPIFRIVFRISTCVTEVIFSF